MTRLRRWWASYLFRLRNPVDPYRCGVCGRLADPAIDDHTGQGFCSAEHQERAVADRSW